MILHSIINTISARYLCFRGRQNPCVSIWPTLALSTSDLLLVTLDEVTSVLMLPRVVHVYLTRVHLLVIALMVVITLYINSEVREIESNAIMPN